MMKNSTKTSVFRKMLADDGGNMILEYGLFITTLMLFLIVTMPNMADTLKETFNKISKSAHNMAK